jgi:tight adherence protein B
MNQFIPVLIFITVLLFIESLYYLYRERRFRAPKRVRERLQAALKEQEGGSQGTDDLLKFRFLSEIPGLNEFLSKFKMFKTLEGFLIQADCTWTVGRFLLTTLLVVTCGYSTAFIFLGWGLVKASMVAVAVGSIPTLVLIGRKRDRERAFEAQLPDVLDLMGRALRAGHSIPGAIQFAGQESPKPTGPEFGRVFEEMNFGMDIQTALKNLAKRVDCYDLRYLIAALTIQRETGGNLSELFDRLSNLIRERFKLIGQTRALTAEGRLSGRILIVMPFVMAGILYIIQPEYLLVLFKDSIGMMIVLAALIMQVLGYLVIRKIVNLDQL